MNRALVIGTVTLAGALAFCACGDFPPPNPTPPTAPDTNDPDYAIRSLKEWFLVGDVATPAQNTLTVFVDGPSGTDFVDVWVGNLPPVRLAEQSSGEFGIQVDIGALPIGAHDVLLAANGSSEAFAKATIKRSAPYYVLVSTDWDFSDPGDQVIAYQDEMHRAHPGLRITHFPGPYTFTDPQLAPARQAQLVEWLVRQRDTYGDEIGLHIHPYCHFVQSAGVACVTDQSTTMPTDATGYTIKLGAYNRADMGTLLEHAADLFVQNGLNRPKTFRAGGWTATLETLGALADKGFTADTSALNWARIEEWTGRELFDFNMANWAPINDTSQPYFPNQSDHLSSAAPTLSLLEVPDNGVMIDYVTLDEMNGLFDANWDGEPLEKPITLMMGFHPAPGFSTFENQRVNGFLDYADLRLASANLGPVVYITLADVVPVFTP
jgi:hypothetical protein